jgi:hypothetical protein
MATWQTITVTGGSQDWLLWGGNITNHEAFAFTLQSAASNVGAFITNVTVFDSTDFHNDGTNYYVTVEAKHFNPVNFALTPTALPLVGNFESNGV